MLKLVWGSDEVFVVKSYLTKCHRFSEHPELLEKDSYRLETCDSREIVAGFVAKLHGTNSTFQVTKENCEELGALCDELGFDGFDSQLERFGRPRPDPNAIAKQRMHDLEEHVWSHDISLQDLQDQIHDLRKKMDDHMKEVKTRIAAIDDKVAEMQRISDRAHRDTWTELMRRVDAKIDKTEFGEMRAEIEQLKERERAITDQLQTLQQTRSLEPSQDGLGIVQFTSEAGQFQGIFAYLRDKCGGNPHDKRIVKVTASSSATNKPHQVINHPWDAYWGSKSKANSEIRFDFKNLRVCVTGYTLKSGASWSPLSWVVEVSDDEKTWDVIDERKTRSLCSYFAEKTYDCLKKESVFRRFVRIRQTGKDSGGTDTLALSQVEFFGRLFEACGCGISV